MPEERKVLVKMLDRAYYMMGYASEFYDDAKARGAVIRWYSLGIGALQLWCSAYGYDLLYFETDIECLDSTRDAMLSKINNKDTSCND